MISTRILDGANGVVCNIEQATKKVERCTNLHQGRRKNHFRVQGERDFEVCVVVKCRKFYHHVTEFSTFLSLPFKYFLGMFKILLLTIETFEIDKEFFK